MAFEPPFRIAVRAILRWLPVSIKTRALWELSPRPEYLVGIVAAAGQAAREGVKEISVIEFGVAGGEGLLALECESEAVERETGIRIRVFGFDSGAKGLPELIGDYRDLPDRWKSGDYAMDEAALKGVLTPRSTLVLGNVSQTIPKFVQQGDHPPIGFIAIDLDLYSSTRDALQILSLPERKMLLHVPIYLDDIDFFSSHRFAGELLAVREFNEKNSCVKIDKWYGISANRPFPERPFLGRMFVAHDLAGISNVSLDRDSVSLPLKR